MKHKHYDMIMAKAANMELVVLSRRKDSTRWVELEVHEKCVSFSEVNNYFLCLPQHKGAVLNLLNGGKCQFLPPVDDGVDWMDFENQQFEKWSSDWWYMDSAFKSRIKPKKEKRWIATIDGLLSPSAVFDDKSKLESTLKGMSYQIHEIHVEV